MLRSESDLVKNYVMSYHYEEDESFEGISKFKKSVTNRNGWNSFWKLKVLAKNNLFKVFRPSLVTNLELYLI